MICLWLLRIAVWATVLSATLGVGQTNTGVKHNSMEQSALLKHIRRNMLGKMNLYTQHRRTVLCVNLKSWTPHARSFNVLSYPSQPYEPLAHQIMLPELPSRIRFQCYRIDVIGTLPAVPPSVCHVFLNSANSHRFSFAQAI